ncbi:MAG: ABC transporter permease, partial [Dehalococcoidia bacterium]
VVEGIPVLATLLSGHSVLIYLALGLSLAAHVFLFRHPLGIWTRAVGEHQVAAASVGIPVRRIQYLMVALSGVLCGLAGAQLSISLVNQFVQGMTAGRGFIALVAVIFGRARPLGVLAACVMFGFTYALTLRLQGAGIPPQFVAMLPYLATIAVLVAVAVRSGATRRRALRPIEAIEAAERPEQA